jgi:hypothetical protein
VTVPETLHFSTSIYSAPAIEETAAAYAGLLECQIRESEGAIAVDLTPKVEDIDDLVDHFANHALHLSIVQHRGTQP